LYFFICSDYIYVVFSTLNTNLGGKAPTSHASSETSYGVGSASNYGHVKLSDTYASNVGAAANAIGASQKALYDAYTKAKSNLQDVTVNVTAGKDYIYYPFRSGYNLVNAYILNYQGVYISGISSDGAANYILFFNTAPSSNSTTTVHFTWEPY
jgi:hypothetical protein